MTWDRAAATAYQKRHRLARRRGRTFTVPLAPVREHIALLLGSGWSQQQIARAVGVDGATIRWIRLRSGYYVNAHLGQRILSVRPENLLCASSGLVPTAGTLRRLQGLMVMGWSHAEMSARAGFDTTRVGRQDALGVGHAQALAVVYDQLSMLRGPSETTRQRAARFGYLPPLAWDDETIDNPAAQPNLGGGPSVDDVAVERAASGEAVTLSTAEREEAVRRLNHRGLNDKQIATRLRISDRSVLRIRQRCDIPAADTGRAA